jgi:hypothetical protein
MSRTRRVAVSVAAFALVVTSSHAVLRAVNEMPKLTVHLTPLVQLTRGDARGVVTVPQDAANRRLRVVLEAEDYYSVSEVQLDGQDAALTHDFRWRDVPPGAYRATVFLYGADRLRASTSIGSTDVMSKAR